MALHYPLFQILLTPTLLIVHTITIVYTTLHLLFIMHYTSSQLLAERAWVLRQSTSRAKGYDWGWRVGWGDDILAGGCAPKEGGGGMYIYRLAHRILKSAPILFLAQQRDFPSLRKGLSVITPRPAILPHPSQGWLWWQMQPLCLQGCPSLNNILGGSIKGFFIFTSLLGSLSMNYYENPT